MDQLHAGAGTGTLVGTVSDSTGAVVANASVMVTNVATSFVSKSVTSPEGAYYIPYLAPGTYRLTVEMSGFKKYVDDGILVSSGEVPRIDVKLELGGVSETVTGSPSDAKASALTGATNKRARQE